MEIELQSSNKTRATKCDDLFHDIMICPPRSLLRIYFFSSSMARGEAQKSDMEMHRNGDRFRSGTRYPSAMDTVSGAFTTVRDGL